MGTLLNVIGIITGGVIGLIAGDHLPERVRDALIRATGAAVVFIGISGALQEMIVVSGNRVEMNGSLMMIVSIAIGVVIGELIGIDEGFEKFGLWLKNHTGSEGDRQFVNAFVTTSLTVCIGAMAIVGAIQDGISGDYTILLTKAILDFLIVMVMSASLGKGCVFSAIPVGILQGSVMLMGKFLGGILIESAISNLSLVGSVLIFCVGVNLIFPKTFRVANMLPGIVVAMIWAYFGV